MDPHQLSKVKASTLKLYRRHAGSFAHWMELHDFYPEDSSEVDDALVEFKADTLQTKSRFEQTVASVEFCLPQCKGHLSWSRAVIAGWNASYVPTHTTPISRPLSYLVGVYLVARKKNPESPSV